MFAGSLDCYSSSQPIQPPKPLLFRLAPRGSLPSPVLESTHALRREDINVSSPNKGSDLGSSSPLVSVVAVVFYSLKYDFIVRHSLVFLVVAMA